MKDQVAGLHAIVHGRVQAVGFRFFVQRQATALGLTGWVRNLDGGSAVEVRAEGPKATLEALVEELNRGPRLASVERVDVAWLEDLTGFDGFQVRS